MNAPSTRPVSAELGVPFISLIDAVDSVKMFGQESSFLLRGQPGIGKTEMARSMAKSLGMECVTIDCGAADLGETALPYIIDNVSGRKTSAFAPNEKFRTELGKPVVILLDEIGKANPITLPIFTTLMQERRVGDAPLPDGNIVVGCTNFDQDGLGDILPAHVDNRCITLYLKNPTAREWNLWAESADVAPDIRGFAETYPSIFDLYLLDDVANQNRYIFNPRINRTRGFVSPRSLVMCDKVVKAFVANRISPERANALLFGAIGPAASNDLMSYIELGRGLPSMELILKDQDTALDMMRAALMALPTLCAQLPTQITTGVELDKVVEFFQSLNQAEATQIFVESVIRRPTLAVPRAQSKRYAATIRELAILSQPIR
jgi:MoxR-like ATPase